jgi:hypothetical protein
LPLFEVVLADLTGNISRTFHPSRFLHDDRPQRLIA